MVDFLADLDSRPLTLANVTGVSPEALFVGQGQQGLEVVVVTSRVKTSDGTLQSVWDARRAGRATPVLLVALYGENSAVCGPSGEKPPVYSDLSPDHVERLCREALRQSDRHAALGFLAQALPSLGTALPGIRNEGLLAVHELEKGSPLRGDWQEACAKSRGVIGRHGNELLSKLGFSIEKLDNLTQLLRSGDQRTALAVLLDQSESVEASTPRFNSLSPISYAISKATSENLPWVIMVQGDRLRLYSTKIGVGVGRRGRTETYLETQPSLLSDEHVGLLWLLFSSDALTPSGSIEDLLESSERFAGDLAERLRDRIYEEVVPRIASGVAIAREIEKFTPEDLRLTYQMALTVLFRLLFIAYAEDRDLLPYRFNQAYRRRSLKQKALELADSAANNVPIAQGDSHWREVEQLWDAVANGNPEWGIPAYDGGLFSSDSSVSMIGAEISQIRLPNEVFEPALRGLLLIETQEAALGPVDFRSLGVREFGTIYEGLLEAELSSAESDLSLDKKGAYIPAKEGQSVIVQKGEVYLHNRSGVRKSSGSYYTKSFAVEHLLERTLDPALDEHFDRLDKLEDVDAGESLFDFRVADIAMGSGHFLIAAIDRIEHSMGAYISRRPLPLILKELALLRTAAEEQLGELAQQNPIEDSQLLRRMIARRCIYGVDLNDLAVQLARLSIWIHTFVPGLPLSLLDRNLACGNSLVGVASVSEIQAKFEEYGGGLFPIDSESLLGQASRPLKKLATIADASLKDVSAARDAAAAALAAIEPTKALCDVITAMPIAEEDIQFQFDRWEQEREAFVLSPVHRTSLSTLEDLDPLHFPVAFPEVFLRENSGFDVIVGNPPWQEVTLEEHAFWARSFPGIRSLPQREREPLQIELRRSRPDLVKQYESELDEALKLRKVLVSGAFPGMGTGDPDLYKAFCWRFWSLTRSTGGRIGVVLPRSALAAKGSTEFRKTMIAESALVDLTLLLNNKQWVFEEVHPQYTIGLVSVTRGVASGNSVRLSGPYRSLVEIQSAVGLDPASFAADEVMSWNDTASIPLLPSAASIEVFSQLRRSPRLDLDDGESWRARPDTELHATNQKNLMDFESEACPPGFWPVFKGESFDVWQPDTEIYYAWADPAEVRSWLFQKRANSARRRRDSAHSEFQASHIQDQSTLACNDARIAFRDVSRATDTRTLRVALIPPQVFVVNTAPYLLWPRGDEKDQAYLLGVLASIPLDWYARRYVETHLNYFVFNPFPVPRPDRTNQLWLRTVELAGRLASTDDRFLQWSEIVEVDCGPIADEQRSDMIQELDAVAAHLYGLSEEQLLHIFETFHEGWDYSDRMSGVMRHFHYWSDSETSS
jgi:hypothetical protein